MEKPLRLKRAVVDPRAWNRETAGDPASWYWPLSSQALTALEEAVVDLPVRPGPEEALGLSVDGDAQAALVVELEPVLSALEAGVGFAIVTGLDLGCYTMVQAQAIYWLVGQALGRPSNQNVQGTLLYDVRDTGQDVAYGARFSVTNAESTFHTDNSFGDEVLDYVGLLCLKTARSGGVNQVVSGYTLHNELLAHEPGALDVLYEPFHVDRRGGIRPGEGPTALRPIFAWDGQGLTLRYLRYWIEAGHAKVGQPLSSAQVHALDVLDAYSHRRDLQAEFALRPGEMFFINNRWMLHNRTAFEDHPDPAQRRHYVRLWLKAQAAPAPAGGR